MRERSLILGTRVDFFATNAVVDPCILMSLIHAYNVAMISVQLVMLALI